MVTAPEVVYIALSTEDPLDDASGIAEPNGNGYARVAHSEWLETELAMWNDGKIVFPLATGDWGVITHYAIYNESIDGEMLACGRVVRSKTVSNGYTCSIASGAIRLSD